MANFKVPTIFSAIDKVSGVAKKMQASVHSFVGSAQAGVARSERMFRRLTPALGETGNQMLSFAKAAAIAGAIIGTLNFSVKSLLQYEDALASTQAVTGTSNTEFIAFRNQISLVAKDTKKSAVDVAKSFEVIGSAKPELLASASALGAVTKASIVLSKASRDDLTTSALNLTGVMNQFTLAADQSDRTINVLSAGAKVGSASISNVGEAMKNFGSVAAGANMSLEQSVAMVEVLGKFSVFGAEAGTKLRGSILKLQQAGIGYKSGQFQINDALLEARNRIEKLKTAKQKDAAVLKMFGAENIATGKILLNNIDLFNEYTKGVTGTNTAHEMAAVNTNTLVAVLDEAKASWVNMITGAEGASTALNTAKTVVRTLTANLSTIVSVGTKILLFFVGWKALLIITKAALIGYNVALGVTGALSGTASVAIGANAVALGAYKVVLGLATAAQWALNVALTANPIGLIIVGIAALIATITLVISKWNEWGAALSIFLGPLGLVISLVQSFRRNWEMISEAFSKGGIIAGLKAIGKTILDAVMMPLQQVAQLLADWTGLDMFKNSAKAFGLARKALGVNVTKDESGKSFHEAAVVNRGGNYGVKDAPVKAAPINWDDEPAPAQADAREAINPEAARQQAMVNRIESTKNFNSLLTIKDETGRADLKNENPLVKMIPVQLTSTMGY